MAEMLDGRFGTDGIRELVHHPMRHGLAGMLSQCIPSREQHASAELLRTKYKPGRKLTAYYRLHIGAEVRPITLTWSAASLSDSFDSADLQDQAAPRHLVAPFARLTARTDSGRTILLIAPIDPQLPQLMRLNDHSYLTAMLANLTPDWVLQPNATRIHAVRYRPGQRHVLQISPALDQEHRTAFVKIDRDDDGARGVRFAQAVGPLLAERSPSTTLATPLGYAVDDRAAVWRGVVGTLMSQEVRQPRRAAAAFTLIGSAVRILHDLDSGATEHSVTAEQLSAPHLARSELASTLGAGQHLTTLVPAVGARYRQLATEVLERLEDLPAEHARIAHGDLKCDNILVAEDRICLLDVDRAGLADPAMDLGKMLADLRWWGRQHSIEVASLVEGFLEGYGPCDPARFSRARLIAVLYDLKIAARRIPVHAVDWQPRVTRQVDEAAERLRRETSP